MTDEADKSRLEPKTADRPHLVSLIFSVAAIVISILSYVESHRSLLLNAEVNRPLVRATSVELFGPIMDVAQFKGPKQTNAYGITFRNSGKAFADDVHIELKAQLEDARTGDGFLKFSDEKDSTLVSETIGDLAPDDEYALTLWVPVLKVNPTIPFGDHPVNMVSLYIKGETTYRSPINGTEYKQPFCFLDGGTLGRFNRCPDRDSH
jgi:hypothetical protein